MDLVPFGLGGDLGKFYALRLTPPDFAEWHPGQYVMIRPEGWSVDLPWARPFSICMLSSRDLVLFFQVLGRGTERMTRLRPDDRVQVVGPLGTSFSMEPETPTLLLAGGVGIAPFVGYVQNHPTPWSLHLDFGHRLPLDCYPFENFSGKILAENYLEKNQRDREKFLSAINAHIAEHASQNGLILACGPIPMLKTVQQLCFKHGAKAQLSLETRMACGVGACLGCVVQPLLDEASGKNKSVHELPEAMLSGLPVPACVCGPVFWADSVDLSKE